MLNILSILEIDGASSGNGFFFLLPSGSRLIGDLLLLPGSRLTGDLLLQPLDFGLALVATETPFIPLSLPLYFSFLGEGKILVTIVPSIPNLFQVLGDDELTSRYQVNWLDGKEASKRDLGSTWKASYLNWDVFMSQTWQRSGFTLSRGGLLVVTYS